MHLTPLIPIPILLLFVPTITNAALNGRCTGSKATGDWKTKGICVRTSTCTAYKGTYKSGACPYDPDDVNCCLVDECSGHPDGLLYHSRCEWTGDSICSEGVGRWLDGEFSFFFFFFFSFVFVVGVRVGNGYRYHTLWWCFLVF